MNRREASRLLNSHRNRHHIQSLHHGTMQNCLSNYGQALCVLQNCFTLSDRTECEFTTGSGGKIIAMFEESEYEYPEGPEYEYPEGHPEPESFPNGGYIITAINDPTDVILMGYRTAWMNVMSAIEPEIDPCLDGKCVCSSNDCPAIWDVAAGPGAKLLVFWNGGSYHPYGYGDFRGYFFPKEGHVLTSESGTFIASNGVPFCFDRLLPDNSQFLSYSTILEKRPSIVWFSISRMYTLFAGDQYHFSSSLWIDFPLGGQLATDLNGNYLNHVGGFDC